MSYLRSRARKGFESQLDEISIELSQLYSHAQAQGSGSRLLAAYYVLAFSELEVFVSRLVEDSVDTLKAAPTSLEKLPELMLGYLVHCSENLSKDYRRFLFDDDEKKIIKRVAETSKGISSWNNSSYKILSNATPSLFLSKKKYPSPKKLPQLFGRLGVDDIWVLLGKTGKINGKLILTSLNDLRTDIVHDGLVPPGFGLRDFKERLTLMRNFVAALDRGLSKHFCANTVKRAVWNSAMA
ncbi:MAG: HEPN domain-containing protein [Pseudomonadota bacterium]